MTEDEALAWIDARFGQRECDALRAYVDLLLIEGRRQNLISPSTFPEIWARHIVDSAQLVAHAKEDWSLWVDVGSGAGLPGLVVAILTGRDTILIEPRRLRGDFLEGVVSALKLPNVQVIVAKSERVTLPKPADIISARAVASLSTLFEMTRPFATVSTRYILPKGAGAHSEVVEARRTWQGEFHVEQSMVDPASGIVVASGVARR